MEPRAVVVQPSGDNYTMWSSTQVPHILRIMLAMVTGVPEHKLRVVAPDVGGGFGGKLQVTPEEVISLLVARRLGKPVKWTETRSESLMTAHHGRDQIQYIDVAADREGNVKGLRCRILADMGAYLRLVSPGVPVLGAFMFNGIYKFPAYRFECDGIFTNKTPTDAYRGAGRPEATFAIERIDRKSTRLNSSHANISYAVFCLKKNKLGSGKRLFGNGSPAETMRLLAHKVTPSCAAIATYEHAGQVGHGWAGPQSTSQREQARP